MSDQNKCWTCGAAVNRPDIIGCEKCVEEKETMSAHEDYSEIESIVEKIGAAEALEQLKKGDAWQKFCDAELEKIRETGVLPDYIYFSPDEKTQEDLLNQRVRPKWVKGEGTNDFEQCEKAVILANNIAKGSIKSELPNSSGFYWWRVSKDEDWRMVQIIDFAADLPGETPSLAAYDVELKAWSGRTLKAWKIHDPIGEWIECQKPKD